MCYPSSHLRPALLRRLATFLFTIATAALSVTAGFSGEKASSTSVPNIVLILTDDLGWGDLRCYGNTIAKTPNLDRLAREGTLFTQFYSAASVCSPSRVAFMTGQFPGRLGVHTVISGTQRNQQSGVPEYVDLKTPFLTRLLKDAGYATAHFGKWHLGSNAKGVPLPGDYGIDVHRTTTTVRGAPTWDDANSAEAKSKSTTQIIDETIRFIADHRDKPFYVNVWTRLPHAPLHPSEAQLQPYASLRPDPDLPYLSAQQIYYASVSDVDTQVGRLMAELENLGLAANTLVAFTSDNGPEVIESRSAGYSGVGSAGPLRGRKRSLYDGGVRVPLIVRWPGRVPAGRVSDDVVSAVDWLPTVCSLAGVAAPAAASRDGHDIADVLRGGSRPREKPLYWEWRYRVIGHALTQSPMAAIRHGQWKLLMNPDRSRVELFDMAHDPGETLNLAAQQAAVVAELAAKLAQWQALLPPSPVDDGAGEIIWKWPTARQPVGAGQAPAKPAASAAAR